MSDKKSTFMSKIEMAEKLFQFKINNDDALECSKEYFKSVVKSKDLRVSSAAEELKNLFAVKTCEEDADHSNFDVALNLVKQIKSDKAPGSLYAAMGGKDLVSTKNFLPQCGGSLKEKLENWIDSNVKNCLFKTKYEMEDRASEIKGWGEKLKTRDLILLATDDYTSVKGKLSEAQNKMISDKWKDYQFHVNSKRTSLFTGWINEDMILVPIFGNNVAERVLNLAMEHSANIVVLNPSGKYLSELHHGFQTVATNYQVKINLTVNDNLEIVEPGRPNDLNDPRKNYRIVIHYSFYFKRFFRYVNGKWDYNDTEESCYGIIDIIHPSLILKRFMEEDKAYFVVDSNYFEMTFREQASRRGYLYVIMDTDKEFFGGR